jgi:hypothetical protein
VVSKEAQVGTGPLGAGLYRLRTHTS